MITLDRVSKSFCVRHDTSRNLGQFLWKGLRGATATRQVQALSDVSLEIKAGERVAILGHNGAGKSTFLKLVSGVLKPSAGALSVRGSVAPLAASAGFDQRLSGRDNLFLRAAFFGIGRARIEPLVAEIAAFAELEEALDAPLHTYSSGMVGRLGFALSLHLQADVYLLDEALSAGDAVFRRKAEAAMRERAGRGGTWVLVTHQPERALGFCERAYLFERGSLKAEGPLEEIIACYHR